MSPKPNAQSVIRRARPDESDVLTDLTVRSKAYWGYDAEFMKIARPALVVTAQQIQNNPAYVLERNGAILGYYTLEKPKGDDIILESLFVAPEAIGSGGGSQLLRHALQMAQHLGYRTVTLDSDPNAEGFYRRMGAEQIGQRPGAIPGRFLPTMRFTLDVDSQQ